MTLLSCSIVVPSLNQARFLGPCLDSLLSQKGVQLEVIVCDGGSTDGSVDILRRYGDQLVWSSEPDSGQTHAINRGIKRATNEVVGYLNSDDLLLPGALENVLPHLCSPSGPEMVYGEANFVDEVGDTIGKYRTAPWTPATLGSACVVCQPTAFWRRELHARLGEFNEELQCSMDYEFWTRLALAKTKVIQVPQTLAASRDYATTKTRSRRDQVYREIIAFQRRLLGRAHAQWWYEYLCYLKWETGLERRRVIPENLDKIERLARLLSRLGVRSGVVRREFFLTSAIHRA